MSSTSKIFSPSKSNQDLYRDQVMSKKSSKLDYVINELKTPLPNQDDVDNSSMGEEIRMGPVSTNILNRDLTPLQHTFDSNSTDNKVLRPKK